MLYLIRKIMVAKRYAVSVPREEGCNTMCGKGTLQRVIKLKILRWDVHWIIASIGCFE